MNVLVISHKPPYPILDGGCLAMSRFLDNIHSVNCIKQITYFTLSTHKHTFDIDKFPIDKYPKTKFENHFVDTKLHPIKALYDLLMGKSYNLSRFYNKEASDKLVKLCEKNNYELIIFESLFACVYLDDLKMKSNARFAYRAHNIENQIWKDLSASIVNPFKKWYLSHLQKKLEQFEKQTFNNVDLIFPLSTNDKSVIEQLTDKNTTLIPVSIEVSSLNIDYENTNLCFIGAFNWRPNVEAVQWFSMEVFPLLKKDFPQLEFHIAGLHAENIANLNEKEGIIIHGFVESSKEFISKHGIFVAPLKSGSGVKMKVLEAMSIGLPCVLTPKGAEGINGILKTNQNVHEIVADIKELLLDKSLRVTRGQNGMQLIKEQFSSESIVRMLSNQIDLIKPKENITNIVIP